MRQFIFRWRGYVLIPTAALVVILSQPTLKSFLGGLLVACCGEALRIWGVGYSGTTTRHSTVIAPQLVTAGPYAYVRNPLYLGNFITALGFLLVAVGGIGWGLRLALLALILVTYVTVYGLIIPLEEAYLLKTFGAPYADYMRRVPRLLPRLSPYPEPQGTFQWEAIQKAEIHTLILFVLIGLIMGARLFSEVGGWALLIRG